MIKAKGKNRGETTRTAVTIASGVAESGRQINTEERYQMIAEAAYYRALQRGFNGGDATDDWLAAEREIDEALLAANPSSVPNAGKSGGM